MIARTLNPAVVLGAVKGKPSRARELRVLDRPCARQRLNRVAGTEEWLRRGRTKEWT